jgi:hypothetical protein
MPKNFAETAVSGKPMVGLSDDFSPGRIDRHLSVAPIMEWTVDRKIALFIR